MKEIGLNNCYHLYKEKFGESIKDLLEQTIIESQKEIEKELEAFVKKHFQDPIPDESSNSYADTRDKIILNEVINSKNYLLNLLDSPYLNLFIKHQEDVPELAKGVTWHWLTSTKPPLPLPKHFKYKNLKKTLVAIGYHSSIYYWNDRFLDILKEKDPSVSWPIKEHLEIDRIKHLEEKLNQSEEKLTRQKELQSKLDVYDKKQFEIQKKAYKKQEKELGQKKDQLSQSQTELQLLKGTYFFYDDRLFENYVFGDILPELKSVYTLLKEYKIYESNWGYFCHCLTVNNYSSSKPLKLKLSLKGSSFDTKDLGYIFNLLQNEFYLYSKTDYLHWLSNVVDIESSRGNPQDIADFYRKHIRPYKKGKTGPAFYDEITEKLHFFIVKLD